MTRPLLTFAVWLLVAAPAAQSGPELGSADRIRLAEAFRLADGLGDRLWPGWHEAPFAVLLVTPEGEFLLRHPKPSPDFALVGDDSLLHSRVWWRARQFDTGLLATFPAVGGIPTIVVGQAESTQAKSSTPWVTTLLHEHFHQLQYSRPGYYAQVNSLGLSHGDSTGMWMLNYPFPYQKPEVGRVFAKCSAAMAAALRARPEATFRSKLAAYLAAKQSLRAVLSADDYKYFSFQLWQEGIARYTECRMAALAAEGFAASSAYRGLADYRSFRTEKTAEMARIERELAVPLDRAHRTAFYGLGAGEGLLLDRVNPDWRGRYFEEIFSLDELFRP